MNNISGGNTNTKQKSHRLTKSGMSSRETGFATIRINPFSGHAKMIYNTEDLRFRFDDDMEQNFVTEAIASYKGKHWFAIFTKTRYSYERLLLLVNKWNDFFARNDLMVAAAVTMRYENVVHSKPILEINFHAKSRSFRKSTPRKPRIEELYRGMSCRNILAASPLTFKLRPRSKSI